MLESILRHIDQVYSLELEVDIRDFLITGDLCAHFGADPRHSKVLVRQNERGEELELGVYIDDEKLGRLREIDLSVQMTSESFETLVTAIEEVSHFAYLLFSASRERVVTELELELQAEVDKFVTATLLLASRNRGRVPKDLLDRLFGDFEVRADIEGRSTRALRGGQLARLAILFPLCASRAIERSLREVAARAEEILPTLATRKDRPHPPPRLHGVIFESRYTPSREKGRECRIGRKASSLFRRALAPLPFGEPLRELRARPVHDGTSPRGVRRLIAKAVFLL